MTRTYRPLDWSAKDIAEKEHERPRANPLGRIMNTEDPYLGLVEAGAEALLEAITKDSLYIPEGTIWFTKAHGADGKDPQPKGTSGGVKGWLVFIEDQR